MREHRERETHERREQADHRASGRARKAERGAENPRDHAVARNAEPGVTRAELESVRREPELEIVLLHVQRRLEPVETAADERAVDEAVTRVVEVAAREPEEQRDAEPLRGLLDDRR